MTSRLAAVIAGALMLAGCGGVSAPMMTGGTPFDLSGDLRDGVGVRHVWAELAPGASQRHVMMRDPDHGWVHHDWEDRIRARQELDSDLTDDVAGEVRQELRQCATGDRIVDVVIRIDEIFYDGPDPDPNGQDAMVALVEIFEADGTGPIARYRVTGVSPRRTSLETPYNAAGLSISINDREDMMAEYLGRELCRTAFGRNPRPSRWLNITN